MPFFFKFAVGVFNNLFNFLDLEVGQRDSGRGQETPPSKVNACVERAGEVLSADLGGLIVGERFLRLALTKPW